MDWQSASEVVAGLVLTGRLALNSVRDELFCSPYDEIIKEMKANHQDMEYLIETIGLSPINACLDAAHSLNGLSKSNWISILENSRALYSAGDRMEKLSRSLRKGENINWAEIIAIARAADTSKTDFTPLSEVEEGEVPFMKTGMKPIDKHLGGVPEVGLVLVAGNPGVGKTDFMAKLSSCMAMEHKDKSIAIFSLEMILSEVAGRFRKQHILMKEDERRIMLDERNGDIDDLINRAAHLPNLGMICIDFADYMIRGETTESAMAHIYRSAAISAKELHIPVVLLAQLNRNYTGGMPRPYHIRYTAMAEILASMLLMLWRPAEDFYVEGEKPEEILQPMPNVGYVLAWKIRGGFREHLDESPGAIAIPFLGKHGWGDQSKWFSLRKVS